MRQSPLSMSVKTLLAGLQMQHSPAFSLDNSPQALAARADSFSPFPPWYRAACLSELPADQQPAVRYRAPKVLPAMPRGKFARVSFRDEEMTASISEPSSSPAAPGA